MITKIESSKAPKAVGPYSQAVRVDCQSQDFLFVSGQIPLDPVTGVLIEGDIKAMTRRVLDNIDAILTEAGLDFQCVVRVEVFLSDMVDFKLVNEVYAEYFQGGVLPARQAVEVSALPLGALIEISCIAVRTR